MGEREVKKAVARLQAAHPRGEEVLFASELAKVRLAFCTHEAFLAYYERVDCDFIYDARSRQYLVRTDGKHVDLLAALYRYYGGVEADDHQAADQFVLSGLGLFKSRAGHVIYRSRDFEVPAELRKIQRDIEVLT